jgi:hypothetical protein
MADSLYVYAIVPRAERPADFPGVEGERLQGIEWRDLVAVAGRVTGHSVRPDAGLVLRHEAAVEAIRTQTPMLPVRFGTVFHDAESLRRALERQYGVLVADLARLGDKQEFGLSALWTTPARDGARAARVDQTSPPAEGRAGGAAYLRSRVEEVRRQDELRVRAQTLAGELNAVLSPPAIEYRQTLAPTPRLALRTAYLLEPGDAEAFKQAFERVRQSRKEIRLLLSGPWPPYSFVSGDHMAPKGERGGS